VKSATLSTFSVEAIAMMAREQHGRAAAYVGLSVILGLACAWLGMSLARALAPAS
jgi:CrcB protein